MFAFFLLPPPLFVLGLALSVLLSPVCTLVFCVLSEDAVLFLILAGAGSINGVNIPRRIHRVVYVLSATYDLLLFVLFAM